MCRSKANEGSVTYSKVSMMTNYVERRLNQKLEKKRTVMVDMAHGQAGMRCTGAVEVFKGVRWAAPLTRVSELVGVRAPSKTSDDVRQ